MPDSALATVATELMTPVLRALDRLGPSTAQLARESGLQILANAGLPLRSFSDLKVRIPHKVAVALLDNAVRVSGDPAFALRAGQQIVRGDFGAFHLLTDAAPTLGESMSLAQQYLPLIHDGATIAVVEKRLHAHWEHRLLPGLSNQASVNEYVVAGFYFAALRSLGLTTAPLEVRFAHRKPTHHAAYEEVFGASVKFGHACNAIVLPNIALDLPLATADAPLLSVLKRYSDDLMTRVPHVNPVVQRARELIREQLAHGATITDLASALHMSVSTLQRRLQAAGLTHSALLDDARKEIATELLNDTELNISEIAFRLGFAHRPAFHRAFQRWYDCAPSEHRARQQHSAFYRFYARSAERPNT